VAVGGKRKTLGIVGGLGPLASADLFFKLVKSTPVEGDKDHFNIIIEQHPFDDGKAGADESFNPTARKLYIFNTIKALEERKIDAILLTCFISHTFIQELESSITAPVINLMEALSVFVKREYPSVRKLGILTSSYVRKEGLFERYFDSENYELIYPSDALQAGCLMDAIYGPRGIKTGQLQGKPVELVQRACQDLTAKGAELIIPGLTELPVIIDALRSQQVVPVIDSNQVYADFAIAYSAGGSEKTYKVGVVGGVGPAATVDFLDKIIQHSKAGKDQDHIRMVIEHNPQIPDRTANLVGDGPDPTIPLYAACKQLEANEADLIAIPCNTSHAYVERIQRYLSIPIVNMLFETVEHIKQHCPGASSVGLLATDGTIQSRVYHDLLKPAGCKLLIPDEQHQKTLMNVIYGEKGIKAGYLKGACLQKFHRVIRHLVNQGADVVILGCTELPLLKLPRDSVAILDPTDILARKCAEIQLFKSITQKEHLN
jgi:aspartate racemase